MTAHSVFEEAEADFDDDFAPTFGESDRLRIQMEHMAAANHNLSELLLSVDAQNDKLLKLLVAMRSLVESPSGPAALRRLHDILITVIGSSEFLIYSVDNETGWLSPIAGAGAAFEACVPLSSRETWLGSLVEAGDVFISSPNPAHFEESSIAAVVPLKVLNRVVGAVVITRLFAQRKPLGACDRDVLGLLGAYAATAIIAADQRPEWSRLPLLLQ